MAWSGASTLIESTKAIFNVLLHQCIAVVLVYSVWGALLNGSTLSWHVILSSFGILPFMAQALMVFGGENVWSSEFEKNTKMLLHGILMTVGTIFTLAGISLGIGNKSGLHFDTNHGIIGLVFLILVILSIFLGLFARFSKTFKGYAKPAILLLSHNVIGMLTFIFAVASLCTGYQASLFVSPTESKTAATVLAGIICVWSMIHAVKSLYKQIEQLL